MDVYVDKDRLETSATTLRAALADAKAQVADSGRLIVEVRLDGQSLEEEELAAKQDRTLGEEEVQFITAEPFELTRQTLLEVRDALTGARQMQQEAAEKLQADDVPGALEQVRGSLEIWQSAQASLSHGSQLLDLDLDELEVDGEPVLALIDQLADQLAQVRDQLMAADWVGLADTLAYELDETAQRWSTLIETVCEKIKQMKQDSQGTTG